MAVIPMCVYACMFVFLWYCVFVVRVDVGVLSQDTARVSADPICVCVDWSLWDSELSAIPVYITGQQGVSRSHLCLC